MFRVGFGHDSHRFSEDPKRKLILGGIEIPSGAGLLGNSDTDVVIHAICRALEQAIGGESFSIYSDKMQKQGINDSAKYLEIAMSHVKQKGYAISNVGISFECKKPKIDPVSEQIKNSLARIMEIEKDKIGISATSGEELTAFGRGEGIQVFAVVSLMKK